MMTSSNGNIFRIAGPLCGEFTGHPWIPLTKASDAELVVFFDLRMNKRLSKQSKHDWRPHRLHYDVTVLCAKLHYIFLYIFHEIIVSCPVHSVPSVIDRPCWHHCEAARLSSRNPVIVSLSSKSSLGTISQCIKELMYISVFVVLDVGMKAWWRRDMKTLSALLALCEGYSPVTGGFPSQKASNARRWRFLCWQIEQDDEKNSRLAGDLKRHDTRVMSLQWIQVRLRA